MKETFILVKTVKKENEFKFQVFFPIQIKHHEVLN